MGCYSHPFFNFREFCRLLCTVKSKGKKTISTQKDNASKTRNIWHLVTIDQTYATGGNNLDLLKRRIRSIVEFSLKEKPAIKSGIARLNLPKNMNQKEEDEKKIRKCSRLQQKEKFYNKHEKVN